MDSLQRSELAGKQSSKRKQTWYPNKQKKRKQFVLEVGMKGFLCTCNFQEKNCIRDAYRLLNEFSDRAEDQDSATGIEDPKVKVENPQVVVKEPQLEGEDLQQVEPEEEADEDISNILFKEVEQLHVEGETPAEHRKFQAVETCVKNALFIQTTLSDPLKLAMSIIKDVYLTKKQRSKFLLRLLPVQIVTKASLDDLKTKANAVLEEYFSQEPKTFSIIFNRHSNSNMQRNDVIEELGNIITNKNPGNKANLKNPEIAVVVEVIRGFCLLSVAPNYMTYKKYNLLEICNPEKQQRKDSKSTNDVVEPTNDDIPQVEGGPPVLAHP